MRLVAHRRLERVRGVGWRRPWRAPSRSPPRAGARRAWRDPARPTAIPIEALTNHSRPLSENGDRSSAPMRSAIRRASSASTTGSRTMPNSSPPNRATVSPGRSPWIRRWPTAASSRSPDRVAEALVDDLEAVEVQQETAIGLVIVGRDDRRAHGRSGRSGVPGWGARSWRRTARRAGRRPPGGRCRGRSRRAWRSDVSASISRGPKCRPMCPEARPRTPTTRPPAWSGTPTTAPNVPSASSGTGPATGRSHRSRAGGRRGRPPPRALRPGDSSSPSRRS